MQHGPLHSFHLYLNHGIALAKYSSREEANKVSNKKIKIHTAEFYDVEICLNCNLLEKHTISQQILITCYLLYMYMVSFVLYYHTAFLLLAFESLLSFSVHLIFLITIIYSVLILSVIAQLYIVAVWFHWMIKATTFMYSLAPCFNVQDHQ